MGKAYSYIRFSSAKQSGGDSYRRQLQLAQDYCQQHGLELADSREYLFFDAGRSAYKGKHLDDTGELARFLTYVDNGSIPAGSTLLVESFDRLSREDVHIAQARFLEILGKGITIVTLNDGKAYTKGGDFTSLIISIVYMARAHEESLTKGKRVSAAWRNKQKLAREEGKPLGKLRPLWLALTDDGYIAIPERVEVVKRIFHLSTKGYGSRNIAVTLNQEAIPSFTAGRKNIQGLWAFSTVRHILESRAVLGEYQPHIFIDGKRTPDGEPIKNYFPAIISEEEWYLAQAARSSRRGTQDQKPITNTSTNFNVWAGILCCSKCGGAMHLIGYRDKKYYRCFNTTRGICNAGTIGTPRAEEVFKEILAKVDSLSLVQGNTGNLNQQISVLNGRLHELNSKYKTTAELHDEMPSRASARILASLEEEITTLEAEQNSLLGQLAADSVTSKSDFFEKLDLVSYEGRAAANSLLKRLRIGVRAQKLGRMYETYHVVKKGGFTVSLFDITHSAKEIKITAIATPIAHLQEAHGEITEAELELYMSDDYNDDQECEFPLEEYDSALESEVLEAHVTTHQKTN